MAGEGKTVCVTGASGFIASWLVKVLLRRGYTVNATVRDLGDATKVAHLLALDGAKDRLHIFEADLLKDGSFDSAVDGCEGVFHTASPVNLSISSDPKAELVEPAVKGTLNVLKSCRKYQLMKRVVLTSSISAAVYTRKPLESGSVINEIWYSDPSVCEQLKLWYAYSKTLAEKAAWSFAEEHDIDLVTINPVFVIGPMLQRTLNDSLDMILNFIKEPHKLDISQPYPSVDVRDVADAHVKALETTTAAGRYMLSASVHSYPRVFKIINQLYSALNLPHISDEGVTEIQISQEKAKSLGVSFISMEVSLKDTIESLKENGYLTIC
ncbi:Phenylacetaldehyde reductase [Linum grandiflorum]